MVEPATNPNDVDTPNSPVKATHAQSTILKKASLKQVPKTPTIPKPNKTTNLPIANIANLPQVIVLPGERTPSDDKKPLPSVVPNKPAEKTSPPVPLIVDNDRVRPHQPPLLGNAKDCLPEGMEKKIKRLSPALKASGKERHRHQISAFEIGKTQKGKYRPSEIPLLVSALIQKFVPSPEEEAFLSKALLETKKERKIATTLNKYMRAFDSMFFGRTLCERLGGLNLKQKEPPATIREWINSRILKKRPPVMDLGMFHPKEFSIYITTDESRHVMTAMTSRIVTLLHEMVHAFFYLHSCWEKCCDKAWFASCGGPGNHGHVSTAISLEKHRC